MAKKPGADAALVYEAASEFTDKALRQDGSIFTPLARIWTASGLTDLDNRFVKRPDDSDDSFEVKFHRQLAGAPQETVQLAAEILYVHLLITDQLRGQTKRDLINGVLGLAAKQPSIPDQFGRALDKGLVNAGQGFLFRRPFQLIYLVEFGKAWKGASDDFRRATLQDPWAFKRFAFSIASPTARSQQHALIHLVHPDTFEPIVSDRHKELIAAAFREHVRPDEQDIDRQLIEIRAALTRQYGPDFSFYSREVKSLWHRKQDETPDEAPAVTEDKRRVWVEKTLVSTRLDRQGGKDELGKSLWSPHRAEDGRDIYRSMREVKPGDVVLHFTDNRAFAGVSRAAGRADDSFIGLAGTAWADRPCYRIALADYQRLDPSLPRESLFEDPDVRQRLVAIRGTHRGLFYDRNMELSQGAYLTEAPPVLVNLLNDVYRKLAGRALPYLGDDPPTASAPVANQEPAVPVTLSWLAEQTLWTEESLQEILDVLQSGTPQVILAGPPGTGKTWIARHLAHFLTGADPRRQRLVQFHPSYTYETFMEGLRPVANKGAIEFQRVPGVVPSLVTSMGASDDPFVLVIDEMNRANLSKVLGELMYLFEYRDQPIDLPYSKAFRLPPNLTFLGTMNTADRSIRSLDIALRRRFHVFECPADVEVLRRYYKTHDNRVPSLYDGFATLNERLVTALDRHHAVGHTFFMAKTMTPDLLWRAWSHKILPLLEDYFFDQSDEVAKFDATQLWPELAD